MRTSSSYARETNRGRHLVVLLLAVGLLFALVAVAVAVVAVALLTDTEKPSTGERSGTSPTQEATDDAPGDGRAGDGAGDYQSDPDTGLPIGATSINGLPAGFPRTDLGAAAMVVEVDRAQIGLDVDTAVATIGVYAAPEDRAFFEDLAEASIAQRREVLRAPATGEVNAPAAYAQTPIGYQVEQFPGDPADEDTDLYLVSVLNQVTTTTTDGQVGRSLYVGQQLASWTPTGGDESTGESAGDWKLVEPTVAAREQLLATPLPMAAVPGTTEFDEAGWTALFETADRPTN